MKNKLSDLNNHLFAQLERLSDEELTPEQIEKEARRGEAIVAVADQILSMASLQIQAAKIAAENGGNAVSYLPVINGEVKALPEPPKPPRHYEDMGQ